MAPEAVTPPEPEASGDAGAPPSSLDYLIANLSAAGTDSATPTRLEEACAQVVRARGFDAEVIGGPVNTDVVLSAALGVNQYTVVVDAKSTARGRVASCA